MMKKKMIALLAAMGVMMAPVLSTEAAWNVDGTGWWYTHEDGGYAVNQWNRCREPGIILTALDICRRDGSGSMEAGIILTDPEQCLPDGSGSMEAGIT